MYNLLGDYIEYYINNRDKINSFRNSIIRNFNIYKYNYYNVLKYLKLNKKYIILGNKKNYAYH